MKSLSGKDKLIYFLNDNGENEGGIYIAAAYSKFIEWQNNIVKVIIDSYNNRENIPKNIYYLKKKIPIQNASSEQLLLFDKKIEESKYGNMNNLISSFSERNIFSEENKINYYNYNLFSYDYDTIEEELEKIVLPGLCQFEDEKRLKFVVYWAEGFRGLNSELISIFYEKYKQKDLNEEEKNKIKKFILTLFKGEKGISDEKNLLREMYYSLEKLIFFFSDNNLPIKNQPINIILKENGQNINISNICKKIYSKMEEKILL